MHKNTDHKHSAAAFDAATASLPDVETEHRGHKLMLAASAVTGATLALALALTALGFGAQHTAATKSDHIMELAGHINN